VPIQYVGTEDLEGLSVYRFEQTIEARQIGTLEVPGDLVGFPLPSFVAPRYYANERTLWVEPTTGAIVKGEERQVQTLRGPDGTDKVTVIDAVVGTSASEVSEGVSTASSLASQIRLFNDTLPLIGGIVGIVLLVVGIILVAIRPRRA
jgi:hypothetical protein